MAERTIFIFGLVSALMNLFGWITVIMSEENKKQYWLGLVMLTISMLVLAWMVVTEMG